MKMLRMVLIPINRVKHQKLIQQISVALYSLSSFRLPQCNAYLWEIKWKRWKTNVGLGLSSKLPHLRQYFMSESDTEASLFYQEFPSSVTLHQSIASAWTLYGFRLWHTAVCTTCGTMQSRRPCSSHSMALKPAVGELCVHAEKETVEKQVYNRVKTVIIAQLIAYTPFHTQQAIVWKLHR